MSVITDLIDENSSCHARIAELEARIVELHNDASYYAARNEELRAELASIKAQEPVAWAGAIEYGVPLLMVEPQNWKATPLYAAPVSEAKAQGVVLTDEELCSIRNQVACNEVRRDDDSRTICVKHGRALETAVLARLNAATVQQVSVPDGWKLVPVELTREMAKAVGDLAERKWCYCLTAANVCEIFSTVLAAAPAAPAADAGHVFYGMDGNHP